MLLFVVAMLTVSGVGKAVDEEGNPDLRYVMRGYQPRRCYLGLEDQVI